MVIASYLGTDERAINRSGIIPTDPEVAAPRVDDIPPRFHRAMSSAQRENSHGESLPSLIERQFGLLASHQAASFKLSPQSISRRVDSGEWERVLPRVYRVVAAPASSRQAPLAAALWAGDGALVSHNDRCRPLGVRRRSYAEGRALGAREAPGAVAARVRPPGTRLDRADRTALDGIPVTTSANADRPLGTARGPQLLALTEDLFLRGIVREDRLRARLAALRSSGRPGAGRLEALLDQRGDGRPLESALETLVWQIIVATAGAPARTSVLGDLGVSALPTRLRVARPDVRPRVRGFAHHGGRRRGEKTARVSPSSPTLAGACCRSRGTCPRRRDRSCAGSPDPNTPDAA